MNEKILFMDMIILQETQQMGDARWKIEKLLDAMGYIRVGFSQYSFFFYIKKKELCASSMLYPYEWKALILSEAK